LEAERPFHLTLFSPGDRRVPGEHFLALVRSEAQLAEMPILHIGESAGSLRKAALRRLGFYDTLPEPIDKTLLFDTLHRACGNLVTGAGVARLMDRHAALGPRTPRLDILLAEPSPEQRCLVRATLCGSGHQVFEVDSGEHAIEALTKHSFDLVIVALDLPGLSTTNALRLFRFSVTQDGWPACIGLAREPSLGQVKDYATVGITAIIPRPVQPDALLRAVADVIRGNGAVATNATSTATDANWAPTDVPCLDEQTLRDVERLTSDPNFLFEVIQEFLADIGTLLEGIQQTRGTEQCYRRLREFGHILQDNAGSLGALRLYQLGIIASEYPAERFERDGQELLGRIESAYRRTRNALWQYLRHRAPTRSPG
jgi:CheY-like chemotaxis protein/HPt (histidine-containing phosphotransfer) domain-containing protein